MSYKNRAFNSITQTFIPFIIFTIFICSTLVCIFKYKQYRTRITHSLAIDKSVYTKQ